MKATGLAVLAFVVTSRNCEAAFGFSWQEIEALCADRSIPLGRIGRRSYVLASDVLEALAGAQSLPWTAADVEAAIARPRGR